MDIRTKGGPLVATVIPDSSQRNLRLFGCSEPPRRRDKRFDGWAWTIERQG